MIKALGIKLKNNGGKYFFDQKKKKKSRSSLQRMTSLIYLKSDAWIQIIKNQLVDQVFHPKKKKPSTLGGIEIIRKREKTSISLSVLIVHVYL